MSRQLQLQLADLVFALLTVAFVCGIVFPFVFPAFRPAPSLHEPTIVSSGAMAGVPPVVMGCVVLSTFLAVIVVLLFGSKKRWVRWLASALVSSVVGAAGFKLLNEYGRVKMAANETAAVYACKVYCAAQQAYKLADHNSDGVLEYSVSASGKFGLSDSKINLLDRDIAAAFVGEGHPAVPWCGYFFKILKRQNKDSLRRGNALDYLERDASGEHMTKGFALIGAPAIYDGTGRNTFIVSDLGEIDQKDVGISTAEYFSRTSDYFVDSTWIAEP